MGKTKYIAARIEPDLQLCMDYRKASTHETTTDMITRALEAYLNYPLILPQAREHFNDNAQSNGQKNEAR